MQPKHDWKSGTRMRFPIIDSYIYIDSAKSDSIGAGHTLSKCHLSELAKWSDKKARQLWADITQTVPMDALIIAESTPQGRIGLFYEVYMDAKAGRNGFTAFFYPWWWEEDYIADVNEFMSPAKAEIIADILGQSTVTFLKEEKSFAEYNKLSPQQMAFRRKKIGEIKLLFFQEYPENDVDCLLPTSLVILGDGKTRDIRSIVKEKYDGYVMSVGKNGELIKKKVIGWHESHRRGRKLFRFSYQHNKGTYKKDKVSAIVTEDHKILTHRGWVEARDLVNGELIATGTPSPSDRAEQVIIGTVLGDGCIHRRKLSFTQSTHQWAEMKASVLHSFYPKLSFTKKHNHRLVYTKPYPYFDWVGKQFYINGIKRVNKELVSKLNDFGIAVWFLDDGCTRIRKTGRPISEIATGNLPLDDVSWLCDWLTSKGYFCKPMPQNHIYHKVQFSVDGTENLLKAIAKYVPDDMRYKLPDGLSPFEKEWYSPEEPNTFWDKVEIREIDVPIQKGRWEKFSKLYCIDVEDTHNFVTIGGTVHNCWLSNDMSIIDASSIRPYFNEIRQGTQHGNVTVWKGAIGGRNYVIGADVASGSARDYSVASVLDVRTMEYVARIRGKINTDMFAEELMKLGHEYNDAMIAVERIGHGHSVLRVLLDKNYPNIYYHLDYDEVAKQDMADAGWKTSAKSKPIMINSMVSCFRAHDLISYSENLLLEASSVTWDNGVDSKVKTTSGGNDDEFMAVAIALQVREQMPVLSTSSQAESYKPIHYAKVF
jgi:hypothetical protein